MSKSASNKSLRSAARAKNDEFYTQLDDITNELKHYKQHFKDKAVLCNCDDPEWSNFWKYFTLNFEHLGLAKLVATHYANSEPSYKLEYFGVDKPVVKTPLQGDGDFRSPECVALLAEVDIVVTNPPFSLFREYLAQLVEHGRQFLIIGNNNAITYKEVFRLLKSGAVWRGLSAPKRFAQPDGSLKSFGNIGWFTNLTHKKRTEELLLYRTYAGNEQAYPTYDHYNAIDVSKVSDIPLDYTGYMGVPITFLDKHNPKQFTIHGIMNTGEENEGIRHKGSPHGRPTVGGQEIYLRILITRNVQTSDSAN